MSQEDELNEVVDLRQDPHWRKIGMLDGCKVYKHQLTGKVGIERKYYLLFPPDDQEQSRLRQLKLVV